MLWDEAAGVESLDQRPFVKNLEAVQGDERDVIVFSLGHAPKQRTRAGKTELYVPAQFGPLGHRGGERRLNVAISRAKQESVVVSSFDLSLLTVANSKHEGPRLLKQFLEFAHNKSHGRHAAAVRVLDLVRETRHSPHQREKRLPIDGFIPLATQLALALEQEGVPHQLDVGTSGFRIPVAVYLPEDPTRFALAILTDEGKDAADMYERHVHRPRTLRMRGWDVMYLTSATWHRRRDEVLAEIFERVPGIRGANDNAVWKAFHAELRAPVIEHTQRAKARNATPRRRVEKVDEPQSVEAALPDWAERLENVRFARALMHIVSHGSLNETELSNIVGGARQARKFSREIEAWNEAMPFRIEVVSTGTAKVYEKR
jgi:hypothetical protein